MNRNPVPAPLSTTNEATPSKGGWAFFGRVRGRRASATSAASASSAVDTVDAVDAVDTSSAAEAPGAYAEEASAEARAWVLRVLLGNRWNVFGPAEPHVTWEIAPGKLAEP